MPRRRPTHLVALAIALAAAPVATATATETWSTDPQDKVFPSTTRPVDASSEASIPAAQDDYEGAIVAIRPDGPITVEPKVGDLVGPGTIGADRIDLFKVAYVQLRQPSTGVDSLEGDGRYPDPLIPIDDGGTIDLPGGETSQVYVRVHVPAGAAPGQYRGDLDLGPAGIVPIVLDVSPVQVNRSDYASVARLDKVALAKAVGVPDRDPALVDGVYGSLLPELARLGVSPGEPPYTTPRVDPATWSLDYSNPPDFATGTIERATNLSRYFGFGFSQNEVPFLPNFPNAGGEDRQYRAEGKRRQAARDFGAAFAPVAGRSFALPVDEPNPRTYDDLRRASQQLKAAVPGIPVLATEAPHPTALAEIGGAVDIWAPPLWDLFKVPDGVAKVRAQGKRVWWYVYGSDTQRYTPNLLIDKPTTEPRLMGWLAARENVSGFFYWGLNSWDGRGYQNPWVDPWFPSHVRQSIACGPRVVGGNGEASLLYPGPDPAHPAYTSLRLEALRDGSEDHSLLTQLRARSPRRFNELLSGLVAPYAGRAEQGGKVGCDDDHRPSYLPVVETAPEALRSARVAALAEFSATPLPRLSGVARFARVPTRTTASKARTAGRKSAHARSLAGAAVNGAWVRFGAFKTTTNARGRWVLPNVSPVPGTLTISRDPNGKVDPVEVEITAEMLAQDNAVVPTPRIPLRASRPLVTKGGLVAWRGRIGKASARRSGQTVRMTMARSYKRNGDEVRFAAGVAPTVTSEFTRETSTRAQRDWRGYRHLEFVAEVIKPANKPYHLIVTPGHYKNARKVAIGNRRQLIRVPLNGMRQKGDVRKLTFGIQSAVPKIWRGGHRLKATVKVRDLRLVR